MYRTNVVAVVAVVAGLGFEPASAKLREVFLSAKYNTKDTFSPHHKHQFVAAVEPAVEFAAVLVRVHSSILWDEESLLLRMPALVAACLEKLRYWGFGIAGSTEKPFYPSPRICLHRTWGLLADRWGCLRCI